MQEIGDLDRLKIVEAELMPGPHAKQAIGMMRRPRLDAGEAALLLVACSKIEQLVEALLAEDERAARAVNFEFELHVAAGLDPVRLDVTSAAAGKAHGQAGDVVDLYLAALR